MKYIIAESKINQFISTYMDGQDFYTWDQGDNEFNVSDGRDGKDLLKYRIQYSSMVPDHSFQVLYLNDDLVNKIMRIFSIRANDAVKSVIDWFNKKYDKSLTTDDIELYIDEEDWQGDENY